MIHRVSPHCRRLFGRLVVTVTSLFIVGSSLVACGSDDGSPFEQRAGNAHSFSVDFSTVPSGPVPLEFDGQRARVYHVPEKNDGAAMRVEGGLLTSEPTGVKTTAAYFTTPRFPGIVSTIGADWVYIPRGKGVDGAMALVVSNNMAKPFPLHLVVTPQQWWYGIWPEDGKLTVISSGAFDRPLAVDGRTKLSVSVRLNGDLALVTMPDGSVESIRDRRIAEWAGQYATFEIYAGKGRTDPGVGFSRVWASS